MIPFLFVLLGCSLVFMGSRLPWRAITMAYGDWFFVAPLSVGLATTTALAAFSLFFLPRSRAMDQLIVVCSVVGLILLVLRPVVLFLVEGRRVFGRMLPFLVTYSHERHYCEGYLLSIIGFALAGFVWSRDNDRDYRSDYLGEWQPQSVLAAAGVVLGSSAYLMPWYYEDVLGWQYGAEATAALAGVLVCGGLTFASLLVQRTVLSSVALALSVAGCVGLIFCYMAGVSDFRNAPWEYIWRQLSGVLSCLCAFFLVAMGNVFALVKGPEA